jgi:porin
MADEASAFTIVDHLSLEGSLAMASQCEVVAGASGHDNCDGATSFMPQLSYTPTRQDQIQLTFNFAVGNSLNDETPFAISPWAATLRDGIIDINGSGRNYLMEAWYAHTFELAEGNSLQLTGGILDSADYLDSNAYADDPLTKFMNAAFVNSYRTLLPSYDLGTALVWNLKDWTFSAVAMHVEELDIAKVDYFFYGLQLAYHFNTRLGSGNCRLVYNSIVSNSLNQGGEGLNHITRWVISFDHELGSAVGGFIRISGLRDNALIIGSATGRYTAGLAIKGSLWRRQQDNIGIAFGYLYGPNLDATPDIMGGEQTDLASLAEISNTPELARLINGHSQVFETYYRFAVNDSLAISADLQYMSDTNSTGSRVDGWVFGVRAVADF